MTPELVALALSALLALVYLSAQALTYIAEVGVKYDVGPRDEGREVRGVRAGRAQRAFSNFLETYPVFVALVVLVSLAEASNGFTVWGAWLYLAFRVVYLPLYLAGVPWLRTFSWNLATLGLVLMLLGVAL